VGRVEQSRSENERKKMKFTVYWYQLVRYRKEVDAKNLSHALIKACEADTSECEVVDDGEAEDFEVRNEKGEVIYADEETQDEY
jgi:hypothetical protein